jgi:hypothetical protein
MVIVPAEAELPQLPLTVTVIENTLKAFKRIVGNASLLVVLLTNSSVSSSYTGASHRPAI